MMELYFCFYGVGDYGFWSDRMGVWRNTLREKTRRVELCIHMSAMTWPKARIPNSMLVILVIDMLLPKRALRSLG